MVTFVNQVPGIDPSAAAGVGKSVEMSDLAKSTLSSLGDMQTDFTEIMEKADVTAMQPSDPSQAEGMEGSLNRTAEMMQITSQVQAQLLQFSMATSISSNMGRNLNTFLKGQ